MAGTFLWSLKLLSGDYNTAALQFTERYELVPQYGITFSTGVDGLSLWLVLLTTFVTPLATFLSWTHIRTKGKEYAMSLLVLEAAIIGGFVTLDLFVFYVFWELTLVPMLLIIGVWGGEQRFRAALKFFLYTLVGSLMMLVAIVYLVEQYRQQTGHFSFELRDLKLLLLPTTTQLWLFSAFALAFAIKVPLVAARSLLAGTHRRHGHAVRCDGQAGDLRLSALRHAALPIGQPSRQLDARDAGGGRHHLRCVLRLGPARREEARRV
jgi:NADH-quinone oxidoreductase subunit M